MLDLRKIKNILKVILILFLLYDFSEGYELINSGLCLYYFSFHSS